MAFSTPSPSSTNFSTSPSTLNAYGALPHAHDIEVSPSTTMISPTRLDHGESDSTLSFHYKAPKTPCLKRKQSETIFAIFLFTIGLGLLIYVIISYWFTHSEISPIIILICGILFFISGSYYLVENYCCCMPCQRRPRQHLQVIDQDENMNTMDFNTDSFRDLTFDLLSKIAQDRMKFDELNNTHITTMNERVDQDQLKKYTREIYAKVLSLQVVQAKSGAQLKDMLHEKIVILYFWTFSNIHSLHTLQKLTTIDKRYSTTGVSLIGIHSPKYEHEKHTANVRHAMEEESIGFIVVNDNALQAWKYVGGQVWPTALVFGPDLLPIFIFEGENHVQYLEKFLSPVLLYYKSSLRTFPNYSPSTTTESIMSEATLKTMRFTYPSHICTTSTGQICISFVGSNQLVFCETDGKVVDIIGNGHAGMVDDDIHQAEFHSPHGIVEHNGCIYIADTNNHAIRVFDLGSRRVHTLIGTGRLGTDKVGGLKTTQQPIASPWDLCITESPFDNKMVLLISMAGQHQVWAYAFEDTQWWNKIILPKNSCSAIIGSGIEGNRNSLEPMNACLASPRGICNGFMSGEPVLVIADSDSSSIRAVKLNSGEVVHIAGGDVDPNNLSAFGDLDGYSYQAKLQHPVGVDYHHPSSQLYITDTFNNKLKRIDMTTLACSSYFVVDTDRRKQRGETNSAKFNEPCGIAILDHVVYVADKNNSLVKSIDLDHGTIARFRFDLSETLNEERSFGSKQAYLTILLDDSLDLNEDNAGTWLIEDKDGIKICDGEITRHESDQMLLDYIPRDKQVGKLRYELMICEKDKCNMIPGVAEAVNETDSTVEFIVKIDSISS